MLGENKKLIVENLVKTYKGRCVVDHVSLELHEAQIVGLLGPNGAGKSTTFYSIVGIIRPDSGAVYLNGENIIAQPMYLRARKGVTYLSQEPSVFRKLTVEQNIMAILETLEIGREERQARLKELLGELRISHLPKIRPTGSPGASAGVWKSPGHLLRSPALFYLMSPLQGSIRLRYWKSRDLSGRLRQRA